MLSGFTNTINLESLSKGIYILKVNDFNKKIIKKLLLTLYIANRAFGGLRKFSAIYKHRQIVDLAFKNE